MITHIKKEREMEKKKLNLEINEIGPMAEKLNLAALPGPCGPCGQGLFDGPAPSNRGWWDSSSHRSSAYAIEAASLGGWYSAGPWGALAFGLTTAAITCGSCHPRGRRSHQNSVESDR